MKCKKQKGFTLIEVLISLTIFVIFVTSISGSYLYIARSQREANAVKEVYSEIRYITNLLTDEARAKTIDYSCYIAQTFSDEPEAVTKGVSTTCRSLTYAPAGTFLALIDAAGNNRTIFKFLDNQLLLYKEYYTGAAWMPYEGYGAAGAESEYREIELKNVKINGLKFEISPLADPFNTKNIACGPVQFQPSVSFYINVQSSRDDLSRFTLNIQKSITTRLYNVKTST
ncbi:type II secretion system protein [Candidatus Peregrinibacteria bacterium]|nr:type II secretion system protein [Candidatus Peregrinibacteria bacterium]